MIARFMERLYSASLAISGALLVVIAVFIAVEISLRALFNTSTNVLAEFVGYAMAPMVTFAMASTMHNGQLIRVSLLTPSLPPAARRWVEVCCVLVTLAAMAWFANLMWQEVALNWRRGAVSDTIARFPLWITPALTLAGLFVFLAGLVHYLVRLVKGTPPIKDPESAELFVP